MNATFSSDVFGVSPFPNPHSPYLRYHNTTAVISETAIHPREVDISLIPADFVIVDVEEDWHFVVIVSINVALAPLDFRQGVQPGRYWLVTGQTQFRLGFVPHGCNPSRYWPHCVTVWHLQKATRSIAALASTDWSPTCTVVFVRARQSIHWVVVLDVNWSHPHQGSECWLAQRVFTSTKTAHSVEHVARDSRLWGIIAFGKSQCPSKAEAVPTK